ncbi:MAG: DUF3037 domain-containing protein [Halothiobacillaceae bacterium]
MKKTPCLYAIVRFMPFVETGEFANVGIILMAPAQRHFAFKLMIQRHARVTRFFEPLDAQVFKATMKHLQAELERVAGVLRQHGFDKRYKFNDIEFARNLFTEIVRPRETVIKFSEPRALLADDLTAALNDLYGHYVERSFVTREYRESVMERGLRKWLFQARLIERFERVEVGDEDYHVAFPFVEQRDHQPFKVIKPLHLAHEQPTKIIEHGGQWLMRIKQLRKRRMLPEQVLFAVQGAATGDARERAYEDIVDDLQKEQVTVMPYTDKEGILRFVTSAH